MPGYLRPVSATGLSSWAAHRRRVPPSTEPGADYYTPIGSPVLVAADGRVVDVGDSIVPATGRFVTVDLDDGRRIRYLHLSRRVVSVGDRVARGQVIAYSGATGYGEEDWSWNVAETGGAHVHTTLWGRHAYAFGVDATLDPELYMTDTPSGILAGATRTMEDDMPINFRSTDSQLSFTMVPGVCITRHSNAFGARLTTYINTGRWPAEDGSDRETAGERQLSDDHIRWMLGQYGFASVAADLNRLPGDGGIVYSDAVQAVLAQGGEIGQLRKDTTTIYDTLTPGREGVKYDGEVYAAVKAAAGGKVTVDTTAITAAAERGAKQGVAGLTLVAKAG